MGRRNMSRTDERELTEIPEGGWTDEHEGMEVRLMMPMGTIIDDNIISLPIEGGVLFGPSQELGMILARADSALRAQMAHAAWVQQMAATTEMDDDEDGEKFGFA